MTYRPYTRTATLGFGGPPSRDVIVLLVIVGVTYSLQFFLGAIAWLRLTPLVWQRGALWQLVTYPWIGLGSASLWILLELLILYWFASDVFQLLRRGRFWNLLIYASAGAGIVAVLVHFLLSLGGFGLAQPFWMMQGQRMLILIVIAAFATLRSDATILLFFVLPIKAKYFLWLEIAFGFISFLGSKDLAGFAGLCSAVGLTVLLLRPGRLRGLGRETRLRLERWLIQRRLGRMRRKSRLRLVDEKKEEQGPWVN